MLHRALRQKQSKPEEFDRYQAFSSHLADQRRQDLATGSTLARLQNRKSDLK